jgi:tetratricopeptide (TPR) repeat protein
MTDVFDADTVLDAAIADHEAGRKAAAEAGYRRILRHDPDHLDALNLLGLLLQDQGDLTGARALLQRAVARDPDFPEALTNLARVERLAGNASAAEAAARRAVALDDTLAEAHLQLGGALLERHDLDGALPALLQATRLAPGNPAAWLQLGWARLRAKDHRAAVDAFRTAASRQPGDATALSALGIALAANDQIDEALVVLRDAAAHAPRSPAVLTALASALNQARDLEASAHLCHEVLALDPDAFQARMLLGGNLAALGDFDGAEQCWRQCLDRKPGSAETMRNLAGIGRPADDDASLAYLDTLLHDARQPLAERLAAGFTLGAVLDRKNMPDAGIAAYALANWLAQDDLQRSGAAFDAGRCTESVNWAIRAFDRTIYEKTAGWGVPSDLPVFVVGMPRSGTTLIEQILASHPRVAAAGELTDIGRIVNRLDGGTTSRVPAEWSSDAVRNEAAAYLERLRHLGGDADRVIDKLPDNAALLGQIAVLFPGARIIICRRDPRDVAVSCYFHQFSGGMSWARNQVDLAIRSHELDRLLRHWRDTIPLPVLEVKYEALVEDLEAHARRLVAFLGLPWDPACLRFHETERPILTSSFWQVRQPLNRTSIGRWRRFSSHIAPLLAGLHELVPVESEAVWDRIADDPDTGVAMAMRLQRAGMLDSAEPVYRAICKRVPTHWQARRQLALLLTEKAAFMEALALLQACIDLQPHHAATWVDLANCRRIAGQLPGAIDAARQAVALDGQSADSHAALGAALVLSGQSSAAITAFQAATALSPETLQSWIGLATALAQSNRYHEAADAWDKIIARNVSSVEMWIDYASVLTRIDRFDAAEQAYRKAISLRPDEVTPRLALIDCLLRAHRIQDALIMIGQCSVLWPDNSALWVAHADCLIILGRFDEAAQACDRALEIDPDSVGALTTLAILGKHKRDSEATERLRSDLNDTANPLRDRIAAGFALGRVLDKEGSFDDAFAAYEAANSMLVEDRHKRGLAFDRQALSGWVDLQIAGFDPVTFRIPPFPGDPSDLPVFVVGMPRSGTTLVEQIIASHPKAFGAGERKDVYPAIHGLEEEGGRRGVLAWNARSALREARAGVGRYRELGGGALRVVDKMPDNVLWLGQIRLLWPNARIVICRRDPRDICLSCYFQHFRSENIMWADDLADCGFRMRQVDRLIRHWMQVIPNNIMELQYESLVADLEGQSRRLIDFLGLEWDPACVSFHKTERAVMTASLWQVRQPIYDSSSGRWRNYRRHLAPLLRELGDLVPPEPA